AAPSSPCPCWATSRRASDSLRLLSLPNEPHRAKSPPPLVPAGLAAAAPSPDTAAVAAARRNPSRLHRLHPLPLQPPPPPPVTATRAATARPPALFAKPPPSCSSIPIRRRSCWATSRLPSARRQRTRHLAVMSRSPQNPPNRKSTTRPLGTSRPAMSRSARFRPPRPA